MLAALLLGLMIAPRSKQADEAYAQAYAEYREALETNEDFPWPHRLERKPAAGRAKKKTDLTTVTSVHGQ